MKEEEILSAIAQSITGNHSLKVIIGNNLGCTNGNAIYVGNDDVIDNTFKVAHDNFLMRLKLMVHETLHCVYTPFDYMISRVNSLANNLSKDEKVVFHIFNMLEDICIEAQVKNVFGGWLLKGFEYGSDIAKKSATNIEDDDPLTEWFNACMQYRDAQNATDKKLKGHFRTEAKEVFEETILKLNNIYNFNVQRMFVFEDIAEKVLTLYRGKTPDINLSTQSNVKENAENGASVSFPNMDKDDDNMTKSKENSDDKGKDNADSPKGSEENSDDKSEHSTSSSEDNGENSDDKAENSTGGSEDGGEGSDDSNTTAKNSTDTNSIDSFKKNDDVDSSENDDSTRNLIREATKFAKSFASQDDENVKVYESLRRNEERIASYECIVKDNQALIKTFENVFRKELKRLKNEVLYGTSGRYDPLKAATDGHRTVNVFKSRRNEGEEKDAAVLISIDESGSMRGEKMRNAKRLAVSITESLFKKVKVQVEGWTSECYDNFTNLYKSFDSKLTHNILAYPETGSTPLGYALERANNLFAKRSERNKVFFMITDGKPGCDTPKYMDPVFIRKEVLKMKKNGIEPIVLVIGDNREFSYYHNLFGDSFISINFDNTHWVKKVANKLKKAARNLE